MKKEIITNEQLKGIINSLPSPFHTDEDAERMAGKAFSLLIRQNPTIKDLKEIAKECRFDLIARDAVFIISAN